MQPFNIPAGAKVYFGAPANPLPRETTARIARLVATIPEVSEAHLPQFYSEDAMPAPAQILVLCVNSKSKIEQAARAVTNKLTGMLPAGMHLDVWPMAEDNAILATVRDLGCRIR